MLWNQYSTDKNNVTTAVSVQVRCTVYIVKWQTLQSHCTLPAKQWTIMTQCTLLATRYQAMSMLKKALNQIILKFTTSWYLACLGNYKQHSNFKSKEKQRPVTQVAATQLEFLTTCNLMFIYKKVKDLFPPPFYNHHIFLLLASPYHASFYYINVIYPFLSLFFLIWFHRSY